MKTVTLTRRSKEMDRLLETAKKQDVVLQTREGDEFVLFLVDDFDYELSRQRCNDKLMAFLDKRFREGRKEKGIPLEEVQKKLGLNSTRNKVTRPKKRTGTFH